MINLALFCEMKPSKDGSSVAIGAGVKWTVVSKILDEKGLAVIGGRESAVGVGGLTFLVVSSCFSLLYSPLSPASIAGSITMLMGKVQRHE